MYKSLPGFTANKVALQINTPSSRAEGDLRFPKPRFPRLSRFPFIDFFFHFHFQILRRTTRGPNSALPAPAPPAASAQPPAVHELEATESAARGSEAPEGHLWIVVEGRGSLPGASSRPSSGTRRQGVTFESQTCRLGSCLDVRLIAWNPSKATLKSE